MLDFKRIGGEITSSPLNENFRKLRNDISIANTNLIFPETNAIVSTIDEMNAIKLPKEGQTCYVVSSGELYRFSQYDNKWHKIADFGQTFRQGFLNSGAVVLEDYIRLEKNSTTKIVTPKMLVYFKDKKGDDRYLKGMYLVESHTIDLAKLVKKSSIYFIYVDGAKVGTSDEIKITNVKTEIKSPDAIYLGAFLVNAQGQVIPHFIYTTPNIAFTADRGHFILKNGEAVGLDLGPDSTGKNLSRRNGAYYAEGVNFTIGKTDNYPIDTDNGDNYNIKHLAAVPTVEKIFYAVPTKNPLEHEIIESNKLITDKYWDGKKLVPLKEGQFSVQQHIVTPNGQNVIFYGKAFYNSKEDAVSNINDVYGIDNDFPHVETTRIVVGNFKNLDLSNKSQCSFFTLGNLTQVGTISPVFADDEFTLYSGKDDDTVPAMMRFSLDELEKENFDDIYKLSVAPYHTIRYNFYADKKYVGEGIEPLKIAKEYAEDRSYYGKGYLIADQKDLSNAVQRINEIEKEIWSLEKENSAIYNQGIRYRLYHSEDRLDKAETKLANHETRIVSLENNKVNKKTTVNGYALGDNTNKDETKAIVLKTGDIDEGTGKGDKTNLWYTEARVSANTDVANATKHIGTVSKTDAANGHTKVNPHNLSTDDLNILTGSDKLLVSQAEERRIRSDKLPDDTKKALADLDAKNLDSVKIEKVDKNSATSSGTITQVGNVKGLRFYEDGVNLSLSPDKQTLLVECKGQIDDKVVMFKNEYAKKSLENPTALKGYVDKAVSSVSAYGINGIGQAGNKKYYGTNATGNAGFYDLQTYVSSADAGSFANIDQITFIPIDGSVQEKHLEIGLRNKINNNYHTVYNSGKINSSEINEFNFGNNLTVSVEGHKATINASGTGGGAGVSDFANLHDVNVVYSGNKGKFLVVNKTENGVELGDMPALDEYMLEAIYVDPNDVTKVRHSTLSDRALSADTAKDAQKVNNKIVDDSKNTNGVLWTASKIKTNTSAQINSEGVKTYSGTTVPTDSTGKNGDIYIML